MNIPPHLGVRAGIAAGTSRSKGGRGRALVQFRQVVLHSVGRDVPTLDDADVIHGVV